MADPGAISIARVAGHGGSPDPLAPASDPLPMTSHEHSVQTASPPDASPIEAADSQRGDGPQGRSPSDSQVMPPALSRLQPNSVMSAPAIASGTGVANGAAMPFAALERMASPQFAHSTRDIELSSGAADAPSTPMTLAIGATSAPLAAPESPSPQADSTKQGATPPFTVQQGSVLASRQGSSIAIRPIDLAARRTLRLPGTDPAASVPDHTVSLAATMGMPSAQVTAQASPGTPTAATPRHVAAPHVLAQTSARHDTPVLRDTVGDAATMAASPASARRATSRAETVHVPAGPDSHWRGELAQLTLPRRREPDAAARTVQSVQGLVESPVSSQSAHSSVATAAVDSLHVQAQTGDLMAAPGGVAATTTATEEQTPAPLALIDGHVQAAPVAPSAMAYAGPVVGGISGTGSLAREVKTDASASVAGKREVSLLDALPASGLARSPSQATFVDAARGLTPNRVSTPTSTHTPIDALTSASTASLIHGARALDSTATETVASAARPTGTRTSATSRVVDASGAEAGPALELTDLAARPHASMNLPPAPAGLAAAAADPQRIALHPSADDVASQGQGQVGTITHTAQGGGSTPAGVVRSDTGAVSRGNAAMQPLQHLARGFAGITPSAPHRVAEAGPALELTELAARPRASMNLPPAPAGLAAAAADPQRIALHPSGDDVASQGQGQVATITASAQGGESTPASVVRSDADAVSRGSAGILPLQHLARGLSGFTPSVPRRAAEAGTALKLTDLAARARGSMSLPPPPVGRAAAAADPQRIELHPSDDHVASQRQVATITESVQGGESTPASVVRSDAGAVSRGRAAMQPLQHLARNFSGTTTPTQQRVAATGRALELVSTRQPNAVDRSRIDASAIVDRAFRDSAGRATPFGAAVDAASDLPLVTAAAAQRHLHQTLDRAPDASTSSPGPSPEQAYGVIPMPPDAASGLHATTRPHEAATAAGQAGAGIDMDEIVERALQTLMLRLDIERERRGFARWA